MSSAYALSCRIIKINSFQLGLVGTNHNLLLSSIGESICNTYRYKKKVSTNRNSLFKNYSSINYKEDSIVTELKDTSLLTIQKLFLQDIKYTVDCPDSKLDCLLFQEENSRNLFSPCPCHYKNLS